MWRLDKTRHWTGVNSNVSQRKSLEVTVLQRQEIPGILDTIIKIGSWARRCQLTALTPPNNWNFAALLRMEEIHIIKISRDREFYSMDKLHCIVWLYLNFNQNQDCPKILDAYMISSNNRKGIDELVCFTCEANNVLHFNGLLSACRGLLLLYPQFQFHSRVGHTAIFYIKYTNTMRGIL